MQNLSEKMLINMQKKHIKISECKPTFMISKKGKPTNVQFAAFRGTMVSQNDFTHAHAGDLTNQGGHKRRFSQPKNSPAFLATGRNVKTASVRGGLGGTITEGVEVGRYTPRYPQTKKPPTFSMNKTGRNTQLFLFAPYTWMRNESKEKVPFLDSINLHISLYSHFTLVNIWVTVSAPVLKQAVSRSS